MTDDELRINIESLHANLTQLYEIVTKEGETLREGIRKLTTRQADNDRQIAQLTTLLAQDAENIRALARIAQTHQDRLDRLEGQ